MNKTTRGMRAGRKLHKLQINRWCSGMRMEIYVEKGWKVPGTAPCRMLLGVRPRAPQIWKIPKRRAAAKRLKSAISKAARMQQGNELKKLGMGIEAKQPNSAISKAARIELMNHEKMIYASVPNDGCLNYVDGNVVKSSGVSFESLFKGMKKKTRF